MQQLNEQFADTPGVIFKQHKELVAVHIENEAASATVFLQGAQLSQYKAKGQVSPIWCSDSCEYTATSPLRGGIPICWPWFGDFDRNPPAVQQSIQQPAQHAQQQTLSAHGFARNKDWLLEKIQTIDSNSTVLTLSLDLAADEHPCWSHATRLVAEFTVSTELTVTFTVHNLSKQTVHFTSALHTYLAVNDIHQTQVSGLEDFNYTDCVDAWKTHRQEGELSVTKEIDRIYFGDSDLIAVKQNMGPNIELHSSGSKSTVVWNPWIDKAQRLSQFGSEDYLSMLCIETANIGDDAVQLAPQQSHQLSVTIRSAIAS
jgi:glucose-6-phosphate 1-epimerase